MLQLYGGASELFFSTDREVVIAGGARTGKAQPLWETVWTPSGPREIGSLAVGDLVLGGDGRSTVVVGVFDQSEQTIYRVEFSTGEEVFCTNDHLWMCEWISNHKTGVVVRRERTAEDIRKRCRESKRPSIWIPMAPPVRFSDPGPLPIPPYALGVLLGDGALTQGRGRFTTYPRDAEIVERVRSLWPRMSTVAGGLDHFMLGADAALRRLGLAFKKSTEKHIPAEYRRASIEDRFELVRGLMDTDGTVDLSSGGMPRFSSSSRQLAEDFLEVVQSLGGAGSISGRPTARADHFIVWFRFDDGPSLFYLKRKRELACTRKKFITRRFFRSIEPLAAPEPARCIRVLAADGLYLTRNFIITHNTNGLLVKALCEAENFPGWRQLFVRMTRRSLSESVLPDWENKILGRGHAALGKRQRESRSTYQFPNGSTVILGGMDDPAGFLSAELDSVKFFQGEQLPSPKSWELLLSRLSGSAGPYVQAVLDVNPAGTQHWILKRCKELVCLGCGNSHADLQRESCEKCGGTELGRMRWIDSRHQDNPLFFDHATGRWRRKGRSYLLGVLGRLRGPQRERYLNHQWVDESGRVLDEWDPAVHLLGGQLEKTRDRGWLLHVKHDAWSEKSTDVMRKTPVPIEWFGAGYDWGWRPDPGNFQVWAYDRYGRRFMVVEVCRLAWQIDRWAQLAEELWKEFGFRYIACDPSMPAIIDAFNTRLTPFAGRGAPAIAVGADNTIRRQSPDLAGIDLMRWGVRDPKGVVRTFLMRDANRLGHDPELRDAGRPCSAEEEITSWVFASKKATGEPLEKPSDDCDDHGMAAWRYEIGEGYGVRLSGKLKTEQYPERSLGTVLRHAEKLAKARAQD